MGSIGAAIGELLSSVAGAFSFVPKMLKVILWALCAVVILPCVFVTHHFYPMWEDWGKEF